MTQGPQIIQFQNSSSYNNRFTLLRKKHFSLLPPLNPTPLEKPLPGIPSLPTTKQVPTIALLQSSDQSSQLRSLQLLFTLEITTGSEKQITPCNSAIRGNTEQVPPLLPPQADSDHEQLGLFCPTAFPSYISTEMAPLVILIKNRFFLANP